jgi:hypothetical protein
LVCLTVSSCCDSGYAFFVGILPVFIYQGTVTNYQNLVCNTRNLFSHIFGGFESSYQQSTFSLKIPRESYFLPPAALGDAKQTLT